MRFQFDVIASEAKQSRAMRDALDCFVALWAPRNDDFGSKKLTTLAYRETSGSRGQPSGQARVLARES